MHAQCLIALLLVPRLSTLPIIAFFLAAAVSAMAASGVDTSACLEKADVLAKLMECRLALA